MSTDIQRFVAVAAAYIMDHLAPPLAAFLAQEGADGVADNAGRDGMRAALAAGMADIEGGRAEAALAAPRFVDAIEAIWTLSIVAVRTPADQVDPDWVDVLVTPAGARATAIALAAARALNLLRGTDVAGEVHARHRQMVERIAAGVAVQAHARPRPRAGDGRRRSGYGNAARRSRPPLARSGGAGRRRHALTAQLHALVRASRRRGRHPIPVYASGRA